MGKAPHTRCHTHRASHPEGTASPATLSSCFSAASPHKFPESCRKSKTQAIKIHPERRAFAHLAGQEQVSKRSKQPHTPILFQCLHPTCWPIFECGGPGTVRAHLPPISQHGQCLTSCRVCRQPLSSNGSSSPSDGREPLSRHSPDAPPCWPQPGRATQTLTLLCRSGALQRTHWLGRITDPATCALP